MLLCPEGSLPTLTSSKTSTGHGPWSPPASLEWEVMRCPGRGFATPVASVALWSLGLGQGGEKGLAFLPSAPVAPLDCGMEEEEGSGPQGALCSLSGPLPPPPTPNPDGTPHLCLEMFPASREPTPASQRRPEASVGPPEATALRCLGALPPGPAHQNTRPSRPSLLRPVRGGRPFLSDLEVSRVWVQPAGQLPQAAPGCSRQHPACPGRRAECFPCSRAPGAGIPTHTAIFSPKEPPFPGRPPQTASRFSSAGLGAQPLGGGSAAQP